VRTHRPHQQLSATCRKAPSTTARRWAYWAMNTPTHHLPAGPSIGGPAIAAALALALAAVGRWSRVSFSVVELRFSLRIADPPGASDRLASAHPARSGRDGRGRLRLVPPPEGVDR
jgi:hypothetical protein